MTSVNLLLRTLFFIKLCVFIFLSSACKEDYPYPSGEGKKPVYVPYDSLLNIRGLPPQPVQKTGTIFLLDTLFFLLEQKKGIHVFNVADSTNPKGISFIQIYAVNDFTVKYPYIYADNGPHLVTILIDDLRNPKLVNYQLNVFKPPKFPPQYFGIFECVDENKGVVIDWIDVYLEEAKCFTRN